MRESYVPLFESMMTSSLWARPGDIVKCWFALLMKADPEGYWNGTAPGLAMQAGVTIETARDAIAILEAPDPDSRDQEHEGRRIQRVPRGWLIFNLKKARLRAQQEAERARKQRWAKEHRAASKGGDYEPPESDFAPSNEEAKQEPLAPCDPVDRQGPSSDAVSTPRSEPVDARKQEERIAPAMAPAEIDAIERELGVPPPPALQDLKIEAEEGRRFHDLVGFDPSAAFVSYAERFGLPPMALHARLGKLRKKSPEEMRRIFGPHGVRDREAWCRDQLPIWKRWWLEDGGQAEPLPVRRRAPPPKLPELGGGTPMPEALRNFVATGKLPTAAEVAA